MRLVQFYTPGRGPPLGSVQPDGKVLDLRGGESTFTSFKALLDWPGGDAPRPQSLASEARAAVTAAADYGRGRGFVIEGARP